MARKPREYGSSGVYHITMRAVNRQDFFLDNDDRIEFLSILKHYKQLYHFEILAYCLMTNHIHLLIKEGDECISNTIKRITIKFVMWYNRKYKRTGNLFQGRFHSEAIDNDSYLLAAFRYIIQNPLHANMEKKVGDYSWTSFSEYKADKGILTDTSMLKSYFSSTSELLIFLSGDYKEDKKAVITHSMESDIKAENPPDFNSRIRKLLPSDEVVKKFLEEKFGYKNLADFAKLTQIKRRQLILSACKVGFSLRSVCRVTGFSRSEIRNAF